MVRKLLAAALAIGPLVACAGLIGVGEVSYDGADAAPVVDAARDDTTTTSPDGDLIHADAPGDGLPVPDAIADAAPISEYRQTILDAKPLAYWRMKPDRGLIADETGKGNALVLTGNVALQPSGAIVNDTDPAASFDGTTSRADAMTSTIFAMIGDSALQPFTLEAWARYKPRPCGAACHFQALFTYLSADSPEPREGYLLYAVADEAGAKLPMMTAEIELMDAGKICENPGATTAWMHVVYVYDGGLNVYIDDALVPCAFSRPPHGMTLRTSMLQVGYHDTDGFFSGDLDELAIYGRALSKLEIGDHYRKGAGK